MKKEEIVEKKEEKPEEKDIIEMEKVSFKEVGGAFLEPEKPEVEDVKEAIAQYPDKVASPEVKKLLQGAIDKVEKGILKPTDGGNVKKTRSLKVSKERSIDYLKKNPVRINTNLKADKKTEKIIENEEKAGVEEERGV